ncbi:MAG: nucleoside 2-deoxyribosyltransferase domain-containing protein [Candidatus Paceibacterota bacterium]|jgi:8-oxo-dGTP pyrophosphatase MutT (NUDIX family)/nucleoside 2-deoxyribosyltransferase
MQIVYTGENLPKKIVKSIFLAGPTPRSKETNSWRPEALRILEEKGFNGTVFVPEFRNRDKEYADDMEENTISWEEQALNMADCILFWIPRDLKTMPAFTTDVEYGEWFKSGKIVLGAPKNAPKMSYLLKRGQKYYIPQATTLENTIDMALAMIGNGALRVEGECQIPLHIWKTGSFQSWYQAQIQAGNRLHSAKAEWVFRVGPKKQIFFIWILHVDIYITAEERHKTNEVVIGRPDISTVALYIRADDIMDSDIVLIKEFCSPAATADGYVWEPPGGSSIKGEYDPRKLAVDEVFEETGLKISPDRIIFNGARQIYGTLLSHKAFLFSAEITRNELDWLISQIGIVHGVEKDTERTYVEIVKLRDILSQELVDWSALGMLFAALTKK